MRTGEWHELCQTKTGLEIKLSLACQKQAWLSLLVKPAFGMALFTEMYSVVFPDILQNCVIPKRGMSYQKKFETAFCITQLLSWLQNPMSSILTKAKFLFHRVNLVCFVSGVYVPDILKMVVACTCRLGIPDHPIHYHVHSISDTLVHILKIYHQSYWHHVIKWISEGTLIIMTKKNWINKENSRSRWFIGEYLVN